MSHNATGNSNRDGLKIIGIGQSAGMLATGKSPQRLAKAHLVWKRVAYIASDWQWKRWEG